MKGKLSNPPVYYTIAQAQFNPVAAMANYINELQNSFRLQGYTLFDQEKVSQLIFREAPAKAEVIELPIWRITNTDRTSGFILGQSHLAYHTTHYQEHSQFFDNFLMGLQEINSIVKLDHFSRLGLRYLNAVLPKSQENVLRYLRNGLHGIEFEVKPKYSLHESIFETKVKLCSCLGNLVNRVYFRLGPLGYPPDISPHNLVIMPKFIKEKYGSHAVIDIDHFIQEQMVVNFEQIKTTLQSLHIGVKKAFEANITEHAWKVWKQ